MISNSVKRRLSVLENTINEAKVEVEQIEILTLLFPDLVIETNRWGSKKFTSKLAANLVTEFETAFSCSCCDDSPLFAYPYADFEGIRVYSNPSSIYIGERCEYAQGGRRYDTDCLEELKKKGFRKELIAKIDKLVSAPLSYLPNDDVDSDEAEGDT